MARTTSSQAPRLNLYLSIHKALRAFMADTLCVVGRTDPGDAGEHAHALRQLSDLLHLCRQHLVHENDFIHTAMERRAPGSAARGASEHDGHVEHIERLAALADTAARAAADDAPQAWLQLYHALSAFVAENYEHMLLEEHDHNAVLWQHYSDDELHAIHGALVASIPPEEMVLVFRWMVPQLSHPERLGMFLGMRRGMPPEVFDAQLALARGLLDDGAWGKLSVALGPVHEHREAA